MQKKILKLTYVLLMVCCFFLFGCGEDTPELDYQATMSLTDNGTETMTIDINMTNPCTVGGTDAESYTDAFAEISLTTSETASGLTLKGYTIEYIPELSEDGTQTLVLPPSINNLVDSGSNTVYMPTNSSTSFTVTCFSFDQKEALNNLRLATNFVVMRYTVRIILYCEADSGQEKNIEVRRTVYFGNYNNC